SDHQAYSVGRDCKDDDECGRKQLMQSMALASGWSLEAFNGTRGCGDYCPDNFACPSGTTCLELPRGSRYDGLQVRRTACLPDPCTPDGGCGASYATCEVDLDCPSASEHCASPVSVCPGICIASECTACKAWLDEHTQHTCFGGNISVDLS